MSERTARRIAAVVAALVMALAPSAGGAEAGRMRMVVADLPYERVWNAAIRAVSDYPLERAEAGRIVTGWRERAPREGEAGLDRVTERVVVDVERAGERITRVTVEVEALGWRDGAWVPVADTEATARAVLARLREAQG
jgi:hypothetical protein